MKAIVLAAGKGTRLGSLTKKTPKAMISIEGKPLLEYIINYLKWNGISNIGINLFTMQEQIVDYFGDGKKFDVEIFYSHEDELLGTAGSIVRFDNWLEKEEDFIVIYGDILTNQKLDPILKLHRLKQSFATLFLHKRQNSNSCVEINDEGRIVSFLERPQKNINTGKNTFVNSAIQVLNKSVLNYIKNNLSYDLPSDVYSRVLKEKKMYGIELKQTRVAIDSAERYKQAVSLVQKGVFTNK